ncbi:MAG: LLM class flavin-dependent oxidoreductase, partial [Actinobacteria bacterium]|nr:LLM class flavin-dependent oxidoreductase [Actinomycetota bacterium]NIS36616.1 LLM class flavin-dependent oxidoreductase [Actinomycetota bacterium]NIT98812.1 LLM class flavin-dependent oxidoreductase [Actinomycetota bacterium]NIU22432.1 LLM class flavin-dependent oxidoreductase [Actinomycetota bacterium]NIU71111.1 LLM class flavin-dependent oxidoreductase [Actinomycetota bacterium]
MADLRFHVLTLTNVPWPEYRDRVRRVEDAGFDVVELGDHFVDWANPPAPWFEAWTTLAAVAADTSSIRLATGVTQIPLRSPGMLAHQAVTVDHISGGRLELGLGTGVLMDPSMEMLGMPNWSAGERVDRFGEYLEIVARLLSQEVTSYEGRFYSVDGAVMNPTSMQTPRIPIVVAALAPRMMAHTARHADIWNTMSFDADFDAQLAELSARSTEMDEICESIGRDPATLRRCVNLFDAEARAGGGSIRYYADEGLFRRLVGELSAAGYTDVGIYYPNDPAQ